MIGELGLSELEPDLERCHARGTQNHGIHADNCAQSETPTSYCDFISKPIDRQRLQANLEH
jgi:hypothetical protein